MSVPYHTIIRQAAVRISSIVGVTATALDSAYLTSPLTATQISSTDFTIGMQKDAVVNVVGRIIRTYASVPNHPFRAYNISQTANIAHKGVIPSTNSASVPIVGVYGAVRDASTGQELTEQPIQIINTIVDDTDSFLKGEYYYFKQVSDRLWHTRTNVVMDVCTFSASNELTTIANNGNAPIPDACIDIAVAGLIAQYVIDDEYTAQANMYGNYFENCLSQMASGAVAFTPAPSLISSQTPVIS